MEHTAEYRENSELKGYLLKFKEYQVDVWMWFNSPKNVHYTAFKHSGDGLAHGNWCQGYVYDFGKWNGCPRVCKMKGVRYVTEEVWEVVLEYAKKLKGD